MFENLGENIENLKIFWKSIVVLPWKKGSSIL